jgi:hypothetical protein
MENEDSADYDSGTVGEALPLSVHLQSIGLPARLLRKLPETQSREKLQRWMMPDRCGLLQTVGLNNEHTDIYATRLSITG